MDKSSVQEDFAIEVVPIKGKRWIANQKIMLTYKTQIDKTKLLEFFDKKSPGYTFCRIAHETGDKNHPYPHTHVVLDSGKVLQTSNCRFF